MIVNLKLSNARVTDVQSFEVRTGTAFVLTASESARWFADNDPVLRIFVRDDGQTALVYAKRPGTVELQLQQGGHFAKVLNITVFGDEASTLNVRAPFPPERK